MNILTKYQLILDTVDNYELAAAQTGLARTKNFEKK